MLLILLKILSLAIGIAFSFMCFGRLYRKDSISTISILLMAFGLSTFIVLQWCI